MRARLWFCPTEQKEALSLSVLCGVGKQDFTRITRCFPGYYPTLSLLSLACVVCAIEHLPWSLLTMSLVIVNNVIGHC